MTDTAMLMIGLVFINVIICLVTGTIGILAFIELRSFMKSTHKIEFMPIDPNAEYKKNEIPGTDDVLDEYGV